MAGVEATQAPTCQITVAVPSLCCAPYYIIAEDVSTFYVARAYVRRIFPSFAIYFHYDGP